MYKLVYIVWVAWIKRRQQRNFFTFVQNLAITVSLEILINYENNFNVQLQREIKKHQCHKWKTFIWATWKGQKHKDFFSFQLVFMKWYEAKTFARIVLFTISLWKAYLLCIRKIYDNVTFTIQPKCREK